MIARLLPLLALALAAVFFGIALYINLAEQPARLGLEDAPLLEQWKVSFGVGFALQGSLAIAAGLAGLGAGWTQRDWRWAAAGLLMLANWPWTLVMIAPINAALLAAAPEAAGAMTRSLIEDWGVVHAGRTALSFIAVGLSLWAGVGPKSSAGA
jgi:Domain of unknown function (DUF1772)